VIYRIGADAYRERVVLAFSRAHAKIEDAGWQELFALSVEWTPPKFPLAAKDFIARGVEKGPLLGAALSIAETSWIDSGFPEEEQVLQAIVGWAIEQARKAADAPSG
jgi:poly(A) polymerase